MGDLNARTGKYSDSVCKEGNNLITNVQSEFSHCPTQRNSFVNELNSHGKRLLEIVKVQTLGFYREESVVIPYTIREQYHDTLAQYKKLLNSKKNDYYNAKISELEKTGDNSDAKTFWQCLKSTDDTRKGEDVPSISEENWLQYFHNLHSNEPLNPAQQNICNELRQNECHGQHSRPLDFMITEREMRKSAKKLKNIFYHHFRIKVEMK